MFLDERTGRWDHDYEEPDPRDSEAELESRYIGRIDIRDDHSLVDLPEGMPREILELLKKVWVSGQQLKIRRADDERRAPPRRRPGGPAPGKPAGPRKGKPPHRGR